MFMQFIKNSRFWAKLDGEIFNSHKSRNVASIKKKTFAFWWNYAADILKHAYITSTLKIRNCVNYAFTFFQRLDETIWKDTNDIEKGFPHFKFDCRKGKTRTLQSGIKWFTNEYYR